MRKLVMSLAVLGGLIFAGTGPASANVATGLAAVHIDKANGVVQKARWRHHGFRHAGFYFGFGAPYLGWGYYPAYPYYYNDYYYPSYGYYYPRWRHHRHWRYRHWRRHGYWGHRGYRGHHRHWGHRGHRGHHGHRRHH